MTTFEDFRELLRSDRSIRRFNEHRRIPEDILHQLVGLVSLCASGRNLQPLKYRIVDEAGECGSLFPLLKWAGYLPDWDGPAPGERPAAYLVQGLDTRITTNPLCDEGIQLQAITLGCTSLGIGACIIKSFNPAKLKEILNLPKWFEPSYVLALGYPNETVVIEPLYDDIKYYRSSDGIHHVPKRNVKNLII